VEGGLAELFAHALGEQHRPARVGLLADDHELLASEARHRVRVALGAAEDVAEALDHHVAHVVTVGVIDLLEVVDVGDEHAELAVESAWLAAIFCSASLEHRALVQEAREAVGRGELLQAAQHAGVGERHGHVAGEHLQRAARGVVEDRAAA
jgi:hypothetical protein